MDQAFPIAIGILIVLFAGFTQGLTSFGFSLIAMPFLSRIIRFDQAVPVAVVLSLGTNLAVISRCYRFVDLKKIRLLLIAGLAAAPLGAMALARVDADILKLGAGIVIVAFSLLLIAGKSFPVRNERLAFIPIGFLSGFLNGSISMSGPPIALFLSNQNAGKDLFRANITAYAIILNAVTIVSFFLNRLIGPSEAIYILWMIPPMLVGVAAGILAAGRLDDKAFKKIALFLILASGLWTIAGALIR